VGLLKDHRAAGSALAGQLLDEGEIGAIFWVVEPVSAVMPVVAVKDSATGPTAPALSERVPSVTRSVEPVQPGI
ncbi:MAG: hypothetical protein H0V74_06255, partial [Chloroflexi bacterium]|nr:hypothetical protein [Chloroflexota bacterium]